MSLDVAAIVFSLLFSGLESTVTKLAAGIDELKLNSFQSASADLRDEGLSEDEWSLLGTDAATLDQEEVVLNDTVVREASQRSDGLLGEISGGHGVVLATFVSDTSADSVHLLVDLSSVMVTHLTTSGDGELNLGRMPSTDTTNSSQTSMGLSWQSSDTESVCDAFVTLTLSDTDDINHLVLVEDVGDADFLLEVVISEFDLVFDGTTVDLDFNEVSLLLSEVDEVLLGVDQDSDNGAIGVRVRGCLG